MCGTEASSVLVMSTAQVLPFPEYWDRDEMLEEIHREISPNLPSKGHTFEPSETCTGIRLIFLPGKSSLVASLAWTSQNLLSYPHIQDTIPRRHMRASWTRHRDWKLLFSLPLPPLQHPQFTNFDISQQWWQCIQTQKLLDLLVAWRRLYNEGRYKSAVDLKIYTA